MWGFTHVCEYSWKTETRALHMERLVGKSCFIKKLIVFTVSAPRNQFLLYDLQTTVLLHLKRSQDDVKYR